MIEVKLAIHSQRLSPFHQALIAHELTLKHPTRDHRKLTRSLSSASVDLQPHQIDAALFAFQSPLSQGALLADEVGLGKTIEAGLVIAQLWAEGRRRILILVPASLRKQWQNELFEKFGLPARILEGPSPSGQNPFPECFQKGEIAICSLHYAYRRLDLLQRAKPFDLVVIDEAHHFRNVWKSNNKIAPKIQEALRGEPKLLLSATPLHNNLMELYGLVSFINPELLGTRESFRFRFVEDSRGLRAQNVEELKARLKGVCKRTLRRQVQEYVRFTERKAELFPFTPYDDEHELYEKVSEYLRRERLAAVPHRQRTLMLLVYRKILASSSFAIAGTLEKLIRRLERLLRGEPTEAEDDESLLEDVDGFEEEREELGGEDDVIAVGEEEFTREEIEAELAELREYHNLALKIKRNAKGEALLRVLQQIFGTRKEGWPEKAVVFTESRRTQQYLLELLEARGYKGQVTTFSGQNTGRIAARAYERWRRDVPERLQEKLSKEAAIREALIHEFKRYTKLLIATEAGAEGINLQFCNVVINYDLPWNPQRVEQRIGRCHRYGQRHDVVVLNFLNERNHADRRVYELLDQKLRLFQGVFGASDEVLGAIGSGVDFEKRILEIYQSCRTPEEIDAAFKKLQEELAERIQDRLAETRRKLLEHFDDDVRARLKLVERQTREELGQLEERMLALLQSVLEPGRIEVEGEAGGKRIRIYGWPRELEAYLTGVRPGAFWLGAGAGDELKERGLERLHLDHLLMRGILRYIKEQPRARVVPVELLYTEGGHKITLLEPYLGREGFWLCFKVAFEGLEREERLAHIVYVHDPERGAGWRRLPQEIAEKFPQVTARKGTHAPRSVPQQIHADLSNALEQWIEAVRSRIEENNWIYINEELEKLDRCGEDVLLQLEAERDRVRREWEEAKRRLQQAKTFQERLALREAVFDLERKHQKKSKEILEKEKVLLEKREKAYKALKAKAELSIQREELVGIAHWVLR